MTYNPKPALIDPGGCGLSRCDQKVRLPGKIIRAVLDSRGEYVVDETINMIYHEMEQAAVAWFGGHLAELMDSRVRAAGTEA